MKKKNFFQVFIQGLKGKILWESLRWDRKFVRKRFSLNLVFLGVRVICSCGGRRRVVGINQCLLWWKNRYTEPVWQAVGSRISLYKFILVAVMSDWLHFPISTEAEVEILTGWKFPGKPLLGRWIQYVVSKHVDGNHSNLTRIVTYRDIN